MSAIRDLFIQHPILVNAKRAEWFAFAYEKAFDHEIENPGSIFAQKDDESIQERLALSNLHDPAEGQESKHFYIQGLKELYALAYARNQGRSEFQGEIELLRDDLSSQEHLYPDVSAILSVDQAAIAADGWN